MLILEVKKPILEAFKIKYLLTESSLLKSSSENNPQCKLSNLKKNWLFQE